MSNHRRKPVLDSADLITEENIYWNHPVLNHRRKSGLDSADIITEENIYWNRPVSITEENQCWIQTMKSQKKIHTGFSHKADTL
jgi:hypothetical protein